MNLNTQTQSSYALPSILMLNEELNSRKQRILEYAKIPQAKQGYIKMEEQSLSVISSALADLNSFQMLPIWQKVDAEICRLTNIYGAIQGWDIRLNRVDNCHYPAQIELNLWEV